MSHGDADDCRSRKTYQSRVRAAGAMKRSMHVRVQTAAGKPRTNKRKTLKTKITRPALTYEDLESDPEYQQVCRRAGVFWAKIRIVITPLETQPAVHVNTLAGKKIHHYSRKQTALHLREVGRLRRRRNEACTEWRFSANLAIF